MSLSEGGEKSDSLKDWFMMATNIERPVSSHLINRVVVQSVEYVLWEHGVVGSNPVYPTKFGKVLKLVKSYCETAVLISSKIIVKMMCWFNPNPFRKFNMHLWWNW